MRTTTTVIVGAGQAGLAMSRCLTERSVDHVLLERGRVANSWRTERWDSLRLLTPNWMSRLPGERGLLTTTEAGVGVGSLDGDPDGYLGAGEVAERISRYGRSFDAPVVEHVGVESLTETDRGYLLTTDRGPWMARSVVVATGPAGTTHRPASSADLDLQQLSPIEYRNPDQIEGRRVLVVGASASGIQLADELARSGLDVTLSVGEHIRLPRTYRGMDIYWWMDAIGVLDQRYDEMPDLARARRLPSAQLVGSNDQRDLDLNEVAETGVEIVGRLAGVAGARLQFSGSLSNLCQSADLKQDRLLSVIDEHARAVGLDAELPEASRPTRTRIPEARLTIPVSEFDAVLWATGFRPRYPWLPPAMLDHKGAVRHDGGVMSSPGMYVLGLPVLRTRRSGLIDGVGRDAEALSEHLMRHLAAPAGRSR